MLHEMEKVKSYQLGLVSWGLITHYDTKGDCNGCLLITIPSLAPPGLPPFKACFRMKFKIFLKHGRLTLNIFKVDQPLIYNNI